MDVPLVVMMVKAKETKGTRVYESTDEDAPITTLYIKKNGIGPDVKSIRVTVEEE
jgi:hypothetical protein